MKTKDSFSFHIFCLTAVFTVGNTIINIPYDDANEKTLLGFIFAILCSLLLLLIICPLIERIFDASESLKKGVAREVVIVFYALICVIILIDTGKAFKDLSDFASKEIIPNTPKLIISIALALTVFYTAIQRDGVILKLSVFAFFIVGVISLFFFILSAPRFKFQNIVLLQMPEAGEVYSQVKPYIVNVLLCCVPALIYQKILFGKIENVFTVTGVLIGFTVIGICLMNSLLLFGVKAAVNTDFSYAASISTVTIGKLFTRMDGFSYFLFFASCLIKITIGIMTVKKLIEKMGLKSAKIIVAVLTAGVFLISYI